MVEVGVTVLVGVVVGVRVGVGGINGLGVKVIGGGSVGARAPGSRSPGSREPAEVLQAVARSDKMRRTKTDSRLTGVSAVVLQSSHLSTMTSDDLV